ncbi:hypothetical protein ACLMAJ_36780 [Nocardia sp. KC 131]|uniref:hypothetical protein n=1 Tax=Nocardia arseniciresistens TaxID=3392119 RepID=UPI00398EFDB9
MPKNLPGWEWMRTFVRINPVTHLIDACRNAMNHGTVDSELGWCLLGIGVIAIIFAPLAVHLYVRDR